MRKKYDEELQRLNEDLIRMAELSETAIDRAVSALVNKDFKLAEAVIKDDVHINDYEKKIEQESLKIIYKEQPVAGDLRNVYCALKMITDIERIGDQAADICSIALKFAGEEYCKELVHIPAMARVVSKMTTDAVRAYVNGDAALCKAVISADDEADGMFSQIRDELVEIIKVTPRHAEQVVYLLMVAKYLEKIGDHAVNIAEWVIFNLTGIHNSTRIL